MVSRKNLPGWRPAHPERKLLSIQDWYGFGVLDGLTESNTYGWQYCGKTACDDQYFRGIRDGQNIAAGKGFDNPAGGGDGDLRLFSMAKGQRRRSGVRK